jgi:hypothetical protein
MVHVYFVEYSNLHEKCLPKLNVINSFNFYCYFIFGIVIAEYYCLHFRMSLFICTDFFKIYFTPILGHKLHLGVSYEMFLKCRPTSCILKKMLLQNISYSLQKIW